MLDALVFKHAAGGLVSGRTWKASGDMEGARTCTACV